MEFNLKHDPQAISLGRLNNLDREKNLFVSNLDPAEQHAYYKRLTSQVPRENRAYRASLMAMNEAFTHFQDKDGSFVREFQSSEGFNQRVWELYLNETFYSLGILQDRPGVHPDFQIERLGQTAFVEAVIASPPQRRGEFDPPEFTFDEKIDNDNLYKYFAFRSHNALMSKVNKLYDGGTKHYWELPHVDGNPFILAYSSFHEDDSHEYSAGDIGRYIYGITPRVNVHGKPGTRGQFDKLGPIELNGRTITPGFFTNYQSTRGVSAIIFSNFASQHKFSRMGRLKGYGTEGIKQVTQVRRYPGAFGKRITAEYRLDKNYSEDWQDGIAIYHNPFAINPLKLNFFNISGVTQYRYEHGQLKTNGNMTLASAFDRVFPDDNYEG